MVRFVILSFVSISISISFSIAQTPTVRLMAHYYSHNIMCYSGQYARLKRNVFSPRRKADVDCVLFSSVGSWFHDLGAAVENARSAVFRYARGRRSLRDWRPAVRTEMKWQRLAGASP